MRWIVVATALVTYGWNSPTSTAQSVDNPPRVSQAGPTCCGNACGPGQPCCPGTVCSQSGQCIPRSCAECGDRGCAIDNATCTATCGPIACCHQQCTGDIDCCSGAVCRSTTGGRRQCVPAECSACAARGRPCEVGPGCQPVCGAPACCNALCATDRDCCGGTACFATTGGERHCLPTECSACTGMHPACQVTDMCEAECIGPPNCGRPCANDAACGGTNQCHDFGSGDRLCVPAAFDSACTACGRAGCRFDAGTCAVQCVGAQGPQ